MHKKGVFTKDAFFKKIINKNYFTVQFQPNSSGINP